MNLLSLFSSHYPSLPSHFEWDWLTLRRLCNPFQNLLQKGKQFSGLEENKGILHYTVQFLSLPTTKLRRSEKKKEAHYTGRRSGEEGKDRNRRVRRWWMRDVTNWCFTCNKEWRYSVNQGTYLMQEITDRPKTIRLINLRTTASFTFSDIYRRGHKSISGSSINHESVNERCEIVLICPDGPPPLSAAFPLKESWSQRLGKEPFQRISKQWERLFASERPSNPLQLLLWAIGTKFERKWMRKKIKPGSGRILENDENGDEIQYAMCYLMWQCRGKDEIGKVRKGGMNREGAPHWYREISTKENLQGSSVNIYQKTG